MLTELHIRNFVIIDELSLRFDAGFNVLTGETGAGKSIIIDAIDLVLGGKARPDLIRSSAEEASIEAVFDLQHQPELCRDLDEAGLLDGTELLVRRTIARSGKNRIFLNGVLATAGQLQGFVARLVTIYGQHEQQGLARSENHLALLDRFAGLDVELTEYRRIFAQLRVLETALAELASAERERGQRLDLLNFQRRELDEATLRNGEEEELLIERGLLQHAERLSSAAAGGYQTLYGEEGAVCEQLSSVATQLHELTRIDPALGQIAEILQSSYYAIEDAALQLRDYAGKITLEPARLDAVEQRLGLLANLKRKYGANIESVLAYRKQIEGEWQTLSNLDDRRESLQQQLQAAATELRAAGSRLSRRRREAATQLQQRVEAELQDLAMPRARFEVRFATLDELGPRGAERGEFLLQANPGEEPKPLARVASGGELSRLMLAINRAAPTGERIATLIFDEVDAGIGGEAATAVGEKLHGVAARHQVLCITHLPQVAAFAHQHFRVSKEETADARTRTLVTHLADNERTTEVARMLGGTKVTAQTLAHADELIRLSSTATGHERNA